MTYLKDSCATIFRTGLIAVLFVSGCIGEDETDLRVAAPARTTLHVGETIQLEVSEKPPDGSPRDLTSADSGTIYYTTAESRLIPEPDGRVTCIGTDGKEQESAVIGVGNGPHHGHIRFELLPSSAKPLLEVSAGKTRLRAGETTQLRVFASQPGSARRELTATSTGTRYLTFPGHGRADPSVVRISDSGLASTVSSLGRYNHRTVIVFVRNGESTGWIELKVGRVTFRES